MGENIKLKSIFMEHNHFKGKKNTEEIIKEKAWYLSGLIFVGTINFFEIINKKIGENQSYYEVELINTKKISKSYAEIQILFSGFGDYSARKFLPENLTKIFIDELLKKLSELIGNSKEKEDITIEEYEKLFKERFLWYRETNKGVELKYESIPTGDTYKIICTELFGVYNRELFYLFEKTFGEVLSSIKIEDLLEEK